MMIRIMIMIMIVDDNNNNDVGIIAINLRKANAVPITKLEHVSPLCSFW